MVCVCVFFLRARLRVCVCTDTFVHACMYAIKTDHMNIYVCMPLVALGSVTSWIGNKRDVRVAPPCTHAGLNQQHLAPRPPLFVRSLQRPPSPTRGLTAGWVQLHGHQDDDGQTQRVLWGYGAVRQQRGNPKPSTLKTNPKP
jgi:hypothetical protein